MKKTIPLSEVRLWKAYFDNQYSRHEKLDWYLAQIAWQISLSNVAKGKKPKISDFLLKFKARQELTKEQVSEIGKAWVRMLIGVASFRKSKDAS